MKCMTASYPIYNTEHGTEEHGPCLVSTTAVDIVRFGSTVTDGLSSNEHLSVHETFYYNTWSLLLTLW